VWEAPCINALVSSASLSVKSKQGSGAKAADLLRTAYPAHATQVKHLTLTLPDMLDGPDPLDGLPDSDSDSLDDDAKQQQQQQLKQELKELHTLIGLDARSRGLLAAVQHVTIKSNGTCSTTNSLSHTLGMKHTG
jgi:hypothetical protein